MINRNRFTSDVKKTGNSIAFTRALRTIPWLTVLIFYGLTSELHGSTTYFSTIDDANAGGYEIGASPFGESFHTGTANGGYLLDSVSLVMQGYTLGASGFHVAIYSDYRGVPLFQLRLLQGSDNPGFGHFSYAGTGLSLRPDTTYWVVASATNSPPHTGYDWGFSESLAYSASDGWKIDATGLCNAAIYSGRWYGFYANGNTHLMQFSVDATLVPEPTPCVLLLSAAALRILRRPKSGRSIVSAEAAGLLEIRTSAFR